MFPVFLEDKNEQSVDKYGVGKPEVDGLLGEARKLEKTLRLLGALAWGSFLDGYRKKEKPHPKVATL